MRPMGRPRLKDKDLPLRMRRKGKRFYYRARDGREVPLGPDLAAARRKWAELENLQLANDLDAKAATELDDQEGPRAAQKLLGHASVTTTEGYIRNRRGARVKPLK